MEAAEALIRWQHPREGTLLPTGFLPLAESSGAILALGRWVLRGACAEARRLRQLGFPLARIAVNVAGAEIRRGDLAGTVKEVLDETGLAPHQLELEFGARLLNELGEESLETLVRLGELGVSLAVDEFGRGTVSLETLARLPVRRIKLDSRLVAGIAENAHDKAAVQATVGLARILGIETVAMGVENEAQLDRLRWWGCDAYQGFLFSAPVGGEAVDVMFP